MAKSELNKIKNRNFIKEYMNKNLGTRLEYETIPNLEEFIKKYK